MAVLIPVKGPTSEVLPADGKTFELEELHKLVGGWIEVVREGDSYLVMDEEGKLKGKAYNEVASDLTGRLHDIVGDVLVCSALEVGEED